MEHTSKDAPIQRITEMQMKSMYELGFHIVQVSFDNEFNPVFLASKKKLPDSDYIDFIENLGLYADFQYKINGWENVK